MCALGRLYVTRGLVHDLEILGNAAFIEFLGILYVLLCPSLYVLLLPQSLLYIYLAFP